MERLYKKHTYIFVGMLFFFIEFLQADVFLKNENIIDSRAVEKIEIMGKELKDKTGINTHILAISTLDNIPIVKYEKNIAKKLNKPYVLLSIAVKEKQVDIISSKNVENKFDKDGILSPYPWSGTILPILADKKGKDKISAAILNGYGDLVDQIASSYDIKLDSSIGNANKIVIGILKSIFYLFLFASIAIIIYKKRKNVGK